MRGERPYQKPDPLTDEQRAAVESCVNLGWKMAWKQRRSEAIQDADLDDMAGEAFLQMCKSIQSHDPAKGAVTTHLATAALFAAGDEFRRALGGWYGMRTRPTLAEATEGKACRIPFEEIEHVLTCRQESSGIETDEFDPLLRELIALPVRWGYVLWSRFFRDQTLGAIAEDMGLCKERVRQIQLKALEQLRCRLAGRVA